MAEQWYFSKHGQRSGPVSDEQLKTLASTGELKPTDMIWKNGMASWTKAGQFKGLFSPTTPNPITPEKHPSNAGAESDALGILASAPHTESNPSDAPSVKRLASEGVQLAQQTLKRSKKALVETFGSAVGHTKTQAFVSLGHLIKHPFRLAFLTTLFVIASGMALGTLVAAFLFPVFVMGYIACIRATIAGNAMVIADFIGFMKHGWDSFWHLFMLLAAFFVTTATMIAPVVIVIALLTFTLGTAGSLIMDLSSHGPSTAQSHSFDQHNYAPSRSSGEPSKLLQSISEFFGQLLGLGFLLILLVVMIVMMTPLASSLILFFFLVQQVSAGDCNNDQRFGLVYRAFVKMLDTAKSNWKEVFISGLFCSCSFIGLLAIVSLFSALLAPIQAKAEGLCCRFLAVL